jgi:hypothetical protein
MEAIVGPVRQLESRCDLILAYAGLDSVSPQIDVV